MINITNNIKSTITATNDTTITSTVYDNTVSNLIQFANNVSNIFNYDSTTCIKPIITVYIDTKLNSSLITDVYNDTI